MEQRGERSLAKAKDTEEISAVISKEDIDISSDVPIYIQLANVLRQKINEEKLQIGELIPPEKEICSVLGVSRSTVRNALTLLESEGVLARRRGKGTYVTKPKLKRGLNNLYNFSTEMRMLGLLPKSELISFELIKAPFEIANLLRVSEEEFVYKITRLRIANDVPMLLETAYIPEKYCPHLSSQDLTDSLYSLITEYTGAEPVEAVETYDVATITEKQAKYLQCSAGSPTFKIRRISTNSIGNVFEVSTIIAPGQRNQYQITLKKEDVSVTRKIN